MYDDLLEDQRKADNVSDFFFFSLLYKTTRFMSCVCYVTNQTDRRDVVRKISGMRAVLFVRSTFRRHL